MTTSKFVVNVSSELDVPVLQVFDAWLNPSQLNNWFTSGATVNPILGGGFRNDDGDSGEYLNIDRPVALSFTWNNKHHQPGSSVHLNFKSTGTLSTRLLLTHTNLADVKEMADLTKGWEWALSSLKSFLETDKGVTSE